VVIGLKKINMKDILTKIWLILSGFGIMFAIISWGQEANIIPPTEVLGGYKGLIATVTGLFLYYYVAKKMN
tara:strand:- start:25 stop:237 length:213 start_codon:yes stop_codon:yes gene_type:complete